VGRQHIREALDRAKAMLRPEQWNMLPDAIKRGPGPRRGGA
jgi:hypothetical protein